MSDARHVTFHKNGKYLYCTASTDIGPTTNGIDMSGMNRPVTRSVYLVVLDKNQPSPLAPESDEEKDQPADKDKLLAKLAEEAKGDKPATQPAVTKIDLPNIDQRILTKTGTLQGTARLAGWILTGPAADGTPGRPQSPRASKSDGARYCEMGG